jgi:hypothetical protein
VVADFGKILDKLPTGSRPGQIVIAAGSNAGKQQISYSCIQPRKKARQVLHTPEAAVLI